MAVHEGADDIFLILPGLMGPRRGLQAVLQAVDSKPAGVAFQEVQVVDDLVHMLTAMPLGGATDCGPVLHGALGHGVELRLLQDFAVGHLSSP